MSLATTAAPSCEVDPQLALPELLHELAASDLEAYDPSLVDPAIRIRHLRLELMPDGRTVLLHDAHCPRPARSSVRASDLLTAIVSHLERSVRVCACIPEGPDLGLWLRTSSLQVSLNAYRCLETALADLRRGEVPPSPEHLVQFLGANLLPPLQPLRAECEHLLAALLERLSIEGVLRLVAELRGRESSGAAVLARSLEVEGSALADVPDAELVLAACPIGLGDRTGTNLLRRWAGGVQPSSLAELMWLPVSLAESLRDGRKLTYLRPPRTLTPGERREVQAVVALLLAEVSTHDEIRRPEGLSAALESALAALS